MSIEIRVIPSLGLAATNVYIVGDPDTREAMLIDAVADAPLLVKTAQDAGWTIKMIVATHAHFDHVLASKELKGLTNAPFITHRNSPPLLERLPQTGVRFTGTPFPEAAVPDRLIGDESEVIELGAVRVETLFTPGHAPDHIALFMREQNILFSGDALFAGSIGRTDLPGGDHDLLIKSIFAQLIPLGDEVVVLPGHGGQTTIGKERYTNPFLQDYA